MSREDCRSSLVIRDRKGTLSDSERLALGAHLKSCESCRIVSIVGADFDEDSGLRLDDGARLARLAESALRWNSQRSLAPPGVGRMRRSRRRTWLFAAATTLVAGGASAAAAGFWAQSAPEQSEVTEVSTLALLVSTRAVSGRVRDALETVTVSERDHVELARDKGKAADDTASGGMPSVARRRPERLAHRPSDVNHRRTGQSAQAFESAAALFRAASAARRRGEVPLAVQLFRRLQKEYAGTRESTLSHVPLGRLLLDSGATASALRQFDGYLRASGGGGLGAEALYGRARALGALGRSSQERRTWQRLLAEYPASPYVSVARSRLARLD